MKEITILSGKGGTGKTSIASALASVAEHAVFCDNDVDAADLHLIFKPKNIEEHSFDSGSKASLNSDLCTNCDLCLEHCRFDAIHADESGKLFINPFQCEGCRLCERICPEAAIASVQYTNNAWFVAESRFGTLVHAAMGPGEENSGKLVTQVRSRARELAKSQQAAFIINDGPPGIGCATIASLSGADAVLVVIEPTMSGLHDAKRLIELAHSFKLELFALINKSDINLEVAETIEKYLVKEKIPLLAKIPFDEDMVKAVTAGKTIIEYNANSEIGNQIRSVWEAIGTNSV